MSQKGHTYSRECEYAEEEDSKKIGIELKDAAKTVKEDLEKLIQDVSVEDMTSTDYNELVSKKISGDASLEDVARIEKFQIQRLYEKPIDSEFMECFNQKKRAIYNRSFMKTFPDEKVRREIDLHRMQMRETVDDFRMDTKYSVSYTHLTLPTTPYV